MAIDIMATVYAVHCDVCDKWKEIEASSFTEMTQAMKNGNNPMFFISENASLLVVCGECKTKQNKQKRKEKNNE